MRPIKFRAWDKDKINVRKGAKGMYKQNGYVLAKAEYHPYANKRGYVPLHRLLIENELGRYLTPRKELVHHIDGNRENNELQNLKLTTPQEHYIGEHFEKRNPNGRFVADEPIFEEIKYRLFDRDKNITQIYTLKELMGKTFRRAKFKFRGRSTGLKDKNGVEVFEGDIVIAWSQGVKGTFEIKRRTDGLWLLYPAWKDGRFWYLRPTEDGRESCEVIGNIFEDGDLIDG